MCRDCCATDAVGTWVLTGVWGLGDVPPNIIPKGDRGDQGPDRCVGLGAVPRNIM